MRIMLLAILLGGCASMSGRSASSDAPPAKCDLAPVAGMIGREASADLAKEALRASGARSLRWKSPGSMVTMDYRPDRLNISVDGANIVNAFDCG